MEDKIFRVPSEYENLNSYFWGLKRNACDELRKYGIPDEPSKTSFGALQEICDRNPKGSLATYILELQKSFRMSGKELADYDKKVHYPEEKELEKIDKDDGVEVDWDSLDGVDEINFDDLISIDE
ncbi:MAG: hypothetical protein HQM14_20565 [SAR324 cluster bacterium]|nr:hypothetical protein [SAR324 cluster bacterium]